MLLDFFAIGASLGWILWLGIEEFLDSLLDLLLRLVDKSFLLNSLVIPFQEFDEVYQKKTQLCKRVNCLVLLIYWKLGSVLRDDVVKRLGEQMSESLKHNLVEDEFGFYFVNEFYELFGVLSGESHRGRGGWLETLDGKEDTGLSEEKRSDTSLLLECVKQSDDKFVVMLLLFLLQVNSFPCEACECFKENHVLLYQ